MPQNKDLFQVQFWWRHRSILHFCWYLLCAELFLTTPGAWRSCRGNIYIQFNIFDVWEHESFGLGPDRIWFRENVPLLFSTSLLLFLRAHSSAFGVQPSQLFWIWMKSRQIAPWQMQKHFLQLNDRKQVFKSHIIQQSFINKTRVCQLYENIMFHFHHNAWLVVVNEPVLSFVCKVVS